MKHANLVTWTGVEVDKISEALAVEFDSGGYKPIPSGANLTDINTGYTIERTLEVFGPKGLGWGLEYEASDLEYQGEGKRVLAIIKKAIFWYKLFDSISGAEMMVCNIPCSGAHQNEWAYAAEGARTSALGGALKGLGFQLPLYKGMWDTPAARENARTDRAQKTKAVAPTMASEVAAYMKELVNLVSEGLSIGIDDAKVYVRDLLRHADLKPDEALKSRELFDEVVKNAIEKDKAG